MSDTAIARVFGITIKSIYHSFGRLRWQKYSKAVGMDSRAVTIAKSAHMKFRITDNFPSATSHTRVQWLPHNRAQQIKLLLWKQKQYVCIIMALSWSQGLLLGVKDFTEVQNHANAAGQFVDRSAPVQGYLHCI